MKRAGAPFVIVLLLAVTACGRQPGDAADGSSPVTTADNGRPSVAHDPRSMTAIDVATGDLSGLASYAGGRELAPTVYHAATGQAASTTPSAEDAGAAAASEGDTGPSAIPVLPTATENSAAAVPPTGQTPP